MTAILNKTQNKTQFEIVSEIISPVYQVGGSVRDELLGLTPKDYDYATPLIPEEIETRIRAAGKRPYTIGKRFGTLGFKSDGTLIEVTTFRKEIYTGNNRKPAVEFVDVLREDLARRDFTINAMARDESGGIIDPFGGAADLQSKIIRAVDNPGTRFSEDPLRLLRMCRLVGQLGFTLDPTTLKAAKSRAFSILQISRERWVQEMDHILSQDDPGAALYLMHEVGLMKFMFPEVSLARRYDQKSPYHQYDLWEHTLEVIRLVPARLLNLRWAALFHDVGKPFVATEKIFQLLPGSQNPEMQKVREDYYAKFTPLPGDFLIQKNFIHHERVSAEIVKRYCEYLHFSNERSAYITKTVSDHMSTESELKEYDREGH